MATCNYTGLETIESRPSCLPQSTTRCAKPICESLQIRNGNASWSTVKIHIKPNARPRFFRARPVPYAFRDKVTSELDRLCKADVIWPVQFYDWAAPIVRVLKSDGSMRLCGDYKQTVNQSAIPDKYPLPKVYDLLASLAGGKSFTKLDLAHAYQQLVLDNKSSKLTTINTHQGLYHYKRLPFGISRAPTIFNTLRYSQSMCLH